MTLFARGFQIVVSTIMKALLNIQQVRSMGWLYQYPGDNRSAVELINLEDVEIKLESGVRV